MQITSQLAIKIIVLGSSYQDLLLEKMEYQYKDKREVFSKEFKITVRSLHDLLFGKVKIIFSSKEPKWIGSSEFAGAIIPLKNFLVDVVVSGEYKLVSPEDLNSVDYFGRKTTLLGMVHLEFTKTPLDAAQLVEENTNNFVEKIMEAIFTREMVDTLMSINEVLIHFFEGSPLCNAKNVMGMALIYFLYKGKDGICDGKHPKNHGCFKIGCLEGYKTISKKRALEARNAGCYTLASFLNSTLMNRTVDRVRNVEGVEDPNIKAILDRVDGLEEEDVLKYHEGCKNIIGFALIKEKSRLVLSLRGTLTKDEVMSDLNSCYTPFLNGYAHSGIKTLFDNFFESEWGNIESELKARNIKRLLITGHSLGAAICTLFHTTLASLGYNEIYDIETIVFSPPPTVSKEISDHRYERITTYNFGNDIIPRMSFGSILDFKYACISLATRFNISEGIAALSNEFNQIVEYLKENNIHPKLHHPGTVIHLKSSGTGNDVVYGAKKVHPEFFNDFISLKDFPRDHMLNRFFEAFDYFLKLSEN